MGDKTTNNKGTCFVIMPIGELASYPKDHFKQVYEDIFKPAIEKAGYTPKRADDNKGSNMIQVGIIEDIVNAPMAICDLSTRNPNVLFELGIRQAFDLPVVLVQEEDTPRIFDIANFNTIDYGKNLYYREVLKDIDKIKEGIESTEDRSNGANSIIKLLTIGKAELESSVRMSDKDETQMLLYSILKKVENLQREIQNSQGEKEIIRSLKPNSEYALGGINDIIDTNLLRDINNRRKYKLELEDGRMIVKTNDED